MYIVKIIIRTTILFIVFAFLYLLIFVLPGLTVKKELVKLEKAIYPKYYQLSFNRSFQMQYLSLKTESMSFSSDKNIILDKIVSSGTDASAEVVKTYKSGFLFFPKREVVTNLDYIKDRDKEYSSKISDILLKEKVGIEKVRKLASAFGNFYLYDIGVDFYGLQSTSDSDREIMVERLNNSNEGLLKVVEKLDELEKTGDYGGDLTKVKDNIKELAQNFLWMEDDLKTGNILSYESIFNSTIEDYEKARKESFQLEQSIFSSNDHLRILADEKDIIQKYEILLDKINQMQGEK